MRPLWNTTGFLARRSSVNKARMWIPWLSDPPWQRWQREERAKNQRTTSEGGSDPLPCPEIRSRSHCTQIKLSCPHLKAIKIGFVASTHQSYDAAMTYRQLLTVLKLWFWTSLSHQKNKATETDPNCCVSCRVDDVGCCLSRCSDRCIRIRMCKNQIEIWSKPPPYVVWICPRKIRFHVVYFAAHASWCPIINQDRIGDFSVNKVSHNVDGGQSGINKMETNWMINTNLEMIHSSDVRVVNVATRSVYYKSLLRQLL